MAGKTTRTATLFAQKKLFGKANTSGIKSDSQEIIGSNVSIGSQTIFGELLPSSPVRGRYLLQGVGDLSRTVEFIRFKVSVIPGTTYYANVSSNAGGDEVQVAGPHGYYLSLPNDYEIVSLNPKKGNGNFNSGKALYETLGKVQIVPPNFSNTLPNPYLLKIYTDDGTGTGPGIEIPLLDEVDWSIDCYNGILFLQDYNANKIPAWAEGFIYVGEMVSDFTSGGIREINAEAGLLKSQSNNVVSLRVDNSIVATLTGSTFTGVVDFNAGLRGSLTTLTDGITPYISAGDGISVSTGSLGQVKISSNYGNPFAFLPAKWNETPEGLIDGNNQTFYLKYSPAPAEGLLLFYNGILLERGLGSDYSVNENQVNMLYPPIAGSKLKAMYPVYNVVDITWNEIPIGEMNGLNNVFVLNNKPANPESMLLFLNGVLQEQGQTEDYILINNIITFLNIPPLRGSKMRAVYQAQMGASSTLIEALASAAAGGSYRKGAFFGSSVIGNVLDISSVGKLKMGYDSEKDIDVYVNGIMLRGASTGANYVMVNQTNLYLNTGINSDDIITVIVRNSIL